MKNNIQHNLLQNSIHSGIKLGLKTITAVLKALDNPHKFYPATHIAGTNGKGSTAKIIARSLEENGYKVGLFVSPHINFIEERYQINNKTITSSELKILLDKIEIIVQELKKRKMIKSITFFEICTTVAFLYFKEEAVDFAVIETGMGGRFDSTNVIKAKDVVITNINYDHEQFLGNTLNKIALEKAGIIHDTANVVLGNISKQISKTIIDDAKTASFFGYQKDYFIKKEDNLYIYYSKNGFLNNFKYSLNLQGTFQQENSASALKTLENLKERGLKLKKEKILKALKNITWKGRYDIVSSKPLIIFDAAHNQLAMQVLLTSLNEDYQDLKFIFIIGILQDKNYINMIKLINLVAKKIIFVQLKTPRSINAKSLAITLKKESNIDIDVSNSFNDAIKPYLQNNKDSIIACGSFFLLEQAYKWKVNQNLSIE